MTAEEIAAALGGEVVGDPAHVISRAVHPGQGEEKSDLAVAILPDAIKALPGSKAGAALVPAGIALPPDIPAVQIAVRAGRKTLPDVTALFRHRSALTGIHPTAVIDTGATVDPTAAIGPFCHVADGAVIGPGSLLTSHVTIAPGTSIGADCHIHAGVRIGAGVTIGDRAVIQPNAVIGADGFSFISVDKGHAEAAKDTGMINTDESADHTQQKVYSLGGVVIGDDVEIGAQSTIDAGTFVPTRVGRGTKIDNLVMIGHNCAIGEDCVLCGQVGLAGSVTVGNRVVLAGQVGVADHLTIGDDVVVGGGSGVGSNIPSQNVYVGFPAIPQSDAIRNYSNLKRMERFLRDWKKPSSD